MVVYIVISILLLLLAIYEYRFSETTKHYLLVGASILLLLLAGLRAVDIDADSKIYQKMFLASYDIGTMFSHPYVFFGVVNFEPSYLIISALVKSVFGADSFQWVLLLYALLSVSLMTKSITKLTSFPLYSMLFFFSSFFFLHTMTQIRGAVAAGFILLSIPEIVSRDHRKFTLYLLLGLFFHYSAIVVLPFYFISNKTLNKTFYLSAIGVAILLALFEFTPFDIILKYDLGVYTEKIKAYNEGQKWEQYEMNLFNFATLFQLLITVVFIFMAEHMKKNKYVIMLTKMSAVGLILFFTLSAIPILASRISDMLSVVLVVLIPYLLLLIKPKALAEFIIISISVLYLLNQLFVNSIISPYQLFFQS